MPRKQGMAGRKLVGYIVLVVLTIVSCKAPPPPPQPPPTPKVQELITTGNSHYSAGKYNEAVTAYTAIINILKNSEDPNLTTALYNRGLARLAKRTYQQAIEDFTATIEMNPNDAHAYIHRGHALAKEKKLDAAIADFTAALTINPNNVEAYYSLGMIHFQKSDYDRTAEVLSRAIAHNPRFARAYNGRGQAYLKAGKVQAAAFDFQKACDMGEQCGCIMLELIENKKNATPIK